MEFRFVAYDPKTDQRLYQLPRTNSVQIGDTFGTRGTLELKYSANAIDARDLPTFLKVQAEVTFDEGHTWAEVGPSLLRLSGEHEDTDAAGMRTLRFVGREWILDKARVGTGELELIDGKRPFYQSSPGRIIRTLILEAQDRGAAQGIKLGNFTTDRDAAGNLWPKVATIYYSPGLPIASVLENLVEQGMCDYRMDGDTLNLYAPETAMGRDLTDRANPVRVHSAITEAPVKYSLEDLASSALLIGDEGFELEVDNPSAPDDYGRLEVTIEQGGVSDPGTARIMVDEALQRGSREIKEITRSQSASGAAFLPYRDYRVGDYVQVLEDGQWQKYRVRELQLTRDGQDWTIHAVINDRLQELLLKLAKRTNGIVNGTKGSGGDGTRPTPPENPGVEPAAPEGLIIDQQVYLDRQGIARGQITAGWGAVTESTKGQAVEIGGYELWWRRNETGDVWTRAAVTTGDLSVSHSPVVLTDTFGNAMAYQWRVRAIASASNRPGPFSDAVTLTMTQDTEPPNVPSLPNVATDLRIITVDIDGLDEFGEAMPVDYNHHRIYFAAAEDMAGAEMVGTLSNPGSWNSASMTPDVPVWVAVSAVDNVGNESAMTPAQSVTPRKLVDDDSIRDAVEGIDNKINNAVDDLNEAIENIVIDANGTTTYWMPTAPDETTDPVPKRGDLWFDTSEEGKNELHRFDGMAWVSAADQRIDTIRQAQDDLAADVDRVRTSVDGKNAITQSTSTPPSQYDGAVGDIWEIMSSMGSGGRSVSRWRWNGTVWVSNLIGDTVLGNVDAAKIGTGYLSADRIEAGSITADKVIVGGASNMISNPSFELGDTGWVMSNMTIDDTIAHSGQQSVKMVGGGGTMWMYQQQRFNVVAGDEYRVSVWGRVDEATGTSSVSGGFRIHSANPDGTPGAEHFSGWQSDRNWSTLGWDTPGEWFYVETRWVSPVTDTVVIRIAFTDAGTRGTRWVDDFAFVPMTTSTLISPGAVTTEKIAAGAITAESGIIASLDAGKINVGEMDGARIKAGTILSDRVMVGQGGNLLTNADFSNDGQGWSGSGWSVLSGAGLSSSNVLRIANTGGTTGSYLGSDEQPSQFRFRVTADTPIRVSGYARSSNDISDGSARIYVRFYTAEGKATNSHAWGSPQSISAGRTIPANSWGLIDGVVVPPDDAIECAIGLFLVVGHPSGMDWCLPSAQQAANATLIQDGAITTDKILANAITAGKIAALAIEADHISANAITADKIRAGAIDGKLITGARIRTAASGRRTELDVEGLRSYDSSGDTVLTTQTSDGSIDMRGILSQTISGVTLRVGVGWEGDYPGVQWSDSNIYNYPPGVGLKAVDGETSKKETLIQGPGVSTGNSYLSLKERGERFRLRTWKGPVSSPDDWIVEGNLTDNLMRVGSSSSNAPYMYFRRGTGDTGTAWIGYQHPSNGGYASLSLRDRRIWLGAYDSNGNVVSRLWGDADSTALTAGTRDLSLFGRDIFHTADRDIVLNAKGTGIYTPGIPETGSNYATLVRSGGVISWLSSSRRYKVAEESIESTVESFEDRLLSVEPKTWYPKRSVEQYADYLTAMETGQEPERDISKIGDIERMAGVIAEDLDEAGLGLFVVYDDNGEPSSVMYEGIAPSLIPIIRRLRDRVDALEQQLGETA